VGSREAQRVLLPPNVGAAGSNSRVQPWGAECLALWHDDSEIFETLRQEFRLDLGYGLETEMWARNYLDEVKALFARVAGRPYGIHPDGDHLRLPEEIGFLVLYGEMSEDEAFADVLRSVFGDKLVEKAVIFEPLYNTAKAAARICAHYI
jgi:hypothetical protein